MKINSIPPASATNNNNKSTFSPVEWALLQTCDSPRFWSTLGFGEYSLMTLPQLVLTDPDYFFWAYETGVFNRSGIRLKSEAAKIHARATSIRVPQYGPERCVVEYRFKGGKIDDLEVVPTSQPAGATDTKRADFIDLSIPRSRGRFDKEGYRKFIDALRLSYLKEFGGDLSGPITKEACEAFFSNKAHFQNNGPVSVMDALTSY